jgi:raffinose/stachyose/melibiose transport system permease protein
MVVQGKIGRPARVAAFVVCSIFSILVLIPIVMIVYNSLRTNGELLLTPFGLPADGFHWENYSRILAASSGFWENLLNSVLATIGTVILLLATACPAAFVLARLNFPGREVVFNVFLIGLLFPLTVAVLPLYIMIRQLDLLNSLWGIILPQAAFSLPVTILILRNFFRAVPRALEDGAAIDGSSLLGFFWRILLPLSRPALAVVTMLAVVGSWNNFLLPLLVLDDQSTWTLPLGVTQFQGQYGTDWVSVMAYLTLAMVPAVVIYLFAERQIVAGLTAGAVKG